MPKLISVKGMKLTANRDNNSRFIAIVSSKEEAASIIDNMEASGTWPEGFDAILDNIWLYTDKWESL